MKGGLAFTAVTSIGIFHNYYTVNTFGSSIVIMGIFTYLSMSLGIGLPLDLMKKELSPSSTHMMQ
jgi:hypothetical protein